MDESTSLRAGSNNNDTNEHRFMDNTNMIDGGEHELEYTLYDESIASDVGKEEDADTSDSTLSASDVDTSKRCDTIAATATGIGAVSTLVGKVNQVQMRCIIGNRDETYCDSPDLKPILYEQCCDLSCDVSDRDETAIANRVSSRSRLPQAESDCSGSSTDVPGTVGKCVKVYTPKRRKSVDEARNKLVHTRCNLVPTTPSSTDSIDLLDEPSAIDVPVTFLTSLDMESAEYILSLSAESIQSIVGGTISDRHTVIGCREMMGISERDADNEQRFNLLTNQAQDHCAKPVLRRSTRLIQQENDETASNGSSATANGCGTATEKQFKNGHSNRMECARVKRKGKEDGKVPDHVATITSGNGKRNNRKSNSKFIVKRNKTSCTALGAKEKEESRTRVSNKFKVDNTERSMVLDQSTTTTLIAKSNTQHESIDRALWGDLSDALDDGETETDLLAYPPNTEIPFAVGLLPLRAALEKMQATPDYQPRKTRSSVAPMKPDTVSSTSSLKRKTYTSISDTVVLSRKQSYNNNNESPNTVCHIRIRAAPSQCMKSRKRFLSDPIASLPTTEIANDRQ